MKPRNFTLTFKMKIAFLCILLSLAFLNSCNVSSNELYPNKTKSRIAKLDYLDFQPHIYLIMKNNILSYSENASIDASMLLDNVLYKNKAINRINKKLLLQSQTEHDTIRQILYELNSKLITKTKLDGIKIPEPIINVMNRDSSDYLAVILVDGFIRTEKNMEEQALKSVGIAVLTLGTFINIPHRHSTFVNMFVFDRANNEIAYFIRNTEVLYSVRNENEMHANFNKMFRNMYLNTRR